MDDFRMTVPTSLGDVHIVAEEGRIHLDTAEMARQCGTSYFERLLEQAIGSNAIDSVAVDRDLGVATIGYDANQWDRPEALLQIARILGDDRPSGVSESEVILNLNSIPGVVTRVDRVRTVDNPPATSRGSSLRGWLSRFSPFGSSSSSPPTTTEAPRSAAVLQGIVIHYTPVEPIAADDRVEEQPEETAIERTTENDLVRVPDASLQTVGWRRVANLAAAGGCFFLSIVGFVTPGIPTVPFVLATSHFLVRSTPALNDRLRESRLFGAMVRDWEDQGGMRRSTKVRTLMVMFGLLGTTVLVSGGALPVLMMSSAMGGIDLLVILAIPTIAESADAIAEQPALTCEMAVA